MSARPRLLFIACEFFDYHLMITVALEAQGWEVVRIPDRPPSSSLMKIIIRKARFLVEWRLNRFYLKKMEGLGKFQKVLIVKGEAITPKVLRVIRDRHCDGKITMYQWDGLRNVPGMERLSSLVDSVFTFDPNDAKKYGFHLLPLFFKRKTDFKPSAEGPAKWLLSFIGSVHSDRLRTIAKVRGEVEKYGQTYAFVYFPSRLIWWFRKIFDRSFGKFRNNELSLKSMPKASVEEIFNSSVAILDIHHPGQTGLTIRTIEALALGKKIVTTNETIKEYEFYRPEYIQIIDRENPKISEDFFRGQNTNSGQIVEKLEINRWVKTLLDG